MTPDIIKFERCEQKIWSAIWEAVNKQTRTTLGMEKQSICDADCLIMKGAADWFFNRVIGLGLQQEVTEKDLDQLIRLYHDRGLPLGISLYDDEKTAKIRELLQHKGFRITNHWFKMVRDSSPPGEITTHLRIAPATKEHHNDLADVIAKGFEVGDAISQVFADAITVPGNQTYLAWHDGIAVAAGTLSIVDGLGHLNTAATLPNFRGHGAQSALVVERLEAGIRTGCRQFISETWVPKHDEKNSSYNNLLRLGFQVAYQRANWVLPVAN